MKKAFTLVEMIIVMVTIGTMATIGVSLDRSKIAATRVRDDVFSFLSWYHSSVRHASMTNFLDGNIDTFTGLQFFIEPSSGSIRRRFLSSGMQESTRSSSQGGYFQLSGTVSNRLERIIVPLTHSCLLASQTLFLYLIYPSESFCFRIVPRTCRLYHCD